MNGTFYRKRSTGLAVAFLAIALLRQFSFLAFFPDWVNSDLCSALFCLWILAAVLLVDQIHCPKSLRVQSETAGLALGFAAMFLCLKFTAGFLLSGIGYSPYDLSPGGILFNFWSILPFLCACEVLRAYVLASLWREPGHFVRWVLLLTALLGLMQTNLYKISSLGTVRDWFIFIAKEILPAFAQSFLLTLLVFCGGAAAGMIYGALISIVLHLMPVLPSLPWIGDAALGIVFPTLAALYVWDKQQVFQRRRSRPQKESYGLSTVFLVLSVAFFWFVVGVFPVYPSVVLTGSMEPGIRPGDVVLIRKFNSEKEIYALAKNDVINFKRDDIVITHRILNILFDEDGNISFQTKGDNNKSPDQEIVMPNDLNGLVKKTVSGAGLPVLWIKGQSELPEGVVDHEEN